MINNYKAFLHCLFIFVFFHALFVIAIHQYQYQGINTFLELVIFPLKFIFNIFVGIYLYVWKHSAVPNNPMLLNLLFVTLLSISLITIHYAFKTSRDKFSANVTSAFFGIFIAHIAVSASLAFVENAFILYYYFLVLFNNLIIVLMSAVYVIFYVKRFKWLGLKNNIICSSCGFFSALFFQLLIGSNLFLKYLYEDSTFIKISFLYLILLFLSLIVSIFITGILQGKIENSYNNSLIF